MDILYEPQYFLPAAALIVVISLVWAQLWAHTHGMYKPTVSNDNLGASREFTVAQGFAWTYIAVLYALAAFSLFVLGYSSESQGMILPFAIGLFEASFFMAVFNIVQTLFFTLIKVWMDRSLSEPAFKVDPLRKRRGWTIWTLAFAVAIGIFFVWVTINPHSWQVGIIVLIIMGAGFVSWLLLEDNRRGWTHVKRLLWEKKKVNKMTDKREERNQ